MNRRLYIQNRLPLFAGQILFLFLAYLYLASLGITTLQFLFIGLPYVLVVCLFHCLDFCKKRKRFRSIAVSLQQMEDKYLFPEVFSGSGTYEEEAWLAVMREMGSSMTARIEELSDQNRSYREFIEAWVHELKQPVSSVRLLCQGMESDLGRRIQARTEEMDHLAEMVLYYARSGDLSRDLIIRPVNLEKIILEAVAQSRHLLIQAGFSLDLSQTFPVVYTDEKALLFVLNQLIRNSISYRREESPMLSITWSAKDNAVSLTVFDNGIGISPQDLPRVFDKGFTGTNGRKNRRSTGMGLYLCKRFCTHMQTELSISSSENGTQVNLLMLPAAK